MATAGSTSRPTPLFGGALNVVLPSGWLDCSDARPVPDHQEVWLEAEGHSRSIIIEILERAEEASDDKCAIYHFVDIAEANGAAEQRIAFTDRLPAEALRPSLGQAAGPSYILHGVQVLPPAGAAGRLGREASEMAQSGGGAASAGASDAMPAGSVQLELALAVVRLPRQRTDLLVSVNRGRPLPVGGAGAAAHEAAEAQQLVDANADATLLAGVVGSLEVSDWGLFGE
jgi:hypothetical protein